MHVTLSGVLRGFAGFAAFLAMLCAVRGATDKETNWLCWAILSLLGSGLA